MLFRSWSCKQRSWSRSCYFGLGLKNLVLFTSMPDPLASGACCPLPKNPTPLSAFGLDFRLFGPHSAASSKSLHFPQCIGVLIETLVVPIFGAIEMIQCIRMQDFVSKIYKKKILGVATPGPPRQKGRHLFTPTPCPPARCWCPSASSRLATALATTIVFVLSCAGHEASPVASSINLTRTRHSHR